MFINPLDFLIKFFRPFEVVDRGSETQLQGGENYWYLLNVRPNIFK